MKRLILFLLFFMLSFTLFGAAQADLLVVSNRGTEDHERAVALFNEKYPGKTVEFFAPKLEDGSTVTMDSRIMAGDTTHVLIEYMGRVGKYATVEMALNFDDYITDQDDFLPGKLDTLRTPDGALRALPLTGGAFGMAVNLRMLDEIGFGGFDFDDWTLADFLYMAEAVKQTYGGDKWVTGLFFGHRSGDYLWMNWLSTFGAEMYAGGDYSKTTIDSEAGRNVFTFWKYLHTNGYVRKDAAILLDDDYLGDMGKGNYLMTAYVPGWLERDQKAADVQGVSDAYYPYKFVEFPRAPGVTRVPAAGSMGGITAFQNDDPLVEEMSAYFAWLFTTAAFQKKSIVEHGEYPTRKSVSYTFDSPYWNQISKIVAENGMLDLGITQSWFADVRVLAFPLAQDVLTDKRTPAEAVAEYARQVDKILAK